MTLSLSTVVRVTSGNVVEIDNNCRRIVGEVVSRDTNDREEGCN